jgi:hypothetical protein
MVKSCEVPVVGHDFQQLYRQGILNSGFLEWRFGILERFLFQATLKNMTLSRTSGIFAHTPSASFVGLRLGPLNGDFGDPKGYELSPTAGAQFYRSQER